MTSLQVTIKTPAKNSERVLLELDADRFERLAAGFGLFNPEFLESVERAEKDYRAGRVKRINSLADLRKKQ